MSLGPFHWLPSAPLQTLALDWLSRAGVEVAVLRLDQIDPLISGNKWFKLAPHLAAAGEAGARGIISLGGAHSNHLHALAAAGKRFGFATVGLLRGHPQDTPTVLDLQGFGMQLHWLGYGGFDGGGMALFIGAVIAFGGFIFAWLDHLDGNTLWCGLALHVSMNLAWNVFSLDDAVALGWQATSLRIGTALLAVAALAWHVQRRRNRAL